MSYDPLLPSSASYLDLAGQIHSNTTVPEYDLSAKKAEKVETLQRKKEVLNRANLSNSYTQMDDGSLESNSNKIWNDMSLDELTTVTARGMSEYGLTQGTDGRLYLPDGREYSGKTSWFYGYGTKQDDSTVKYGKARGDLPSPDYRYLPGQAAAEGYKVGKDGYGWESGYNGVDVNKRQMGALMPEEVTTTLEGLIHGNKQALGMRMQVRMIR